MLAQCLHKPRPHRRHRNRRSVGTRAGTMSLECGFVSGVEKHDLCKWQMLLNFGKCKCIHIGHGNMDEEYKMGDAVLGRTTQEKDLGVTFSADMKVSEQCGIAASKGNQIIGLIRRTIMYKEKQLIVPLYKAIIRPHLEYCIQA